MAHRGQQCPHPCPYTEQVNHTTPDHDLRLHRHRTDRGGVRDPHHARQRAVQGGPHPVGELPHRRRCLHPGRGERVGNRAGCPGHPGGQDPRRDRQADRRRVGA